MPDIFNTTFHKVDSELSSLAATQNTHSGCTAVTAFLRVEDPNGKPPTDSQLVPLASIDSSSDAALSAQESNTGEASSSSSSNSNQGGTSSPRSSIRDKRRSSGGSSREKIMSFITRNTTRSRRESSSAGGKNAQSAEQEQAYSKIGLRRVLYTANVGDARAVIWSVSRHNLPSRLRLSCHHSCFQSQWTCCSIDIRPQRLRSARSKTHHRCWWLRHESSCQRHVLSPVQSRKAEAD